MYILDDYKNAPYKIRSFHIIDGFINDHAFNPIALAMKEAFDNRYFILCTSDTLIVAESQEKYEADEFDSVQLSYKIRQFLFMFNNGDKVFPMVICMGEIPKKEDALMLYRFGENWRQVAQGRF